MQIRANICVRRRHSSLFYLRHEFSTSYLLTYPVITFHFKKLQSQIFKMCDKWDEFTNNHKSSWLEQKELFIIEKHPQKKMGSNFLVNRRLNWTNKAPSGLWAYQLYWYSFVWVQGILGPIMRPSQRKIFSLQTFWESFNKQKVLACYMFVCFVLFFLHLRKLYGFKPGF